MNANTSGDAADASPPPSFDLAVQLHHAGNLQQAEQLYRRILAEQPRHVEALHMLGLLAHQVGHHDAAIDLMRQALSLQPAYFEARCNLGNVYQHLRRWPEALACYQEALRYNPQAAGVHNNLGSLYFKQGQPDEAVRSYREVLRIAPEFIEAWGNLGAVLGSQGKLDEAVACCEQAIRLNPNYADAYGFLAVALKLQGRTDEALAAYRRALQLNPGHLEHHSNLLFALHNRSGISLAELAEAHADFERRHTAAFRSRWQPHPNTREPQRKLRLGFVSPDFTFHPVGYFAIRPLENIDRSQADVVCYSSRPLFDTMTERFRRTATLWRDVLGLSDAQLAQQIRADQIDILFDLSGHTAGNRLITFALKPAPVQISWAGYVGTTGLAAMDYVLADRYQAPPGTEPFYSERILRMPDAYICYDPPAYAPPVKPLAALSEGRVTFGSFNSQAKLAPEVIRLWARILARVPQSRMLLKYRGMGDPSVARRLAEQFRTAGVDPGRVEFSPFSPHAELLEQYNRVDIGLDPFPYSGGVTSCEALWMGVPVITCPGETFASRHALTHLSNIGLTETIAPTFQAYEDLAVGLAADLPRLAALRTRLRPQMAASPLCDGARFAHNLMNVLRDAWRRYCSPSTADG